MLAASDGRFERTIGTALLLLLAIGCFVVLRPFLSAVIWAVILTAFVVVIDPMDVDRGRPALIFLVSRARMRA